MFYGKIQTALEITRHRRNFNFDTAACSDEQWRDEVIHRHAVFCDQFSQETRLPKSTGTFS